MRAFLSVLSAPKSGSAEIECEDVAVVFPVCGHDEMVSGPIHVALADGASESLLARDWANLLATSMLRSVCEEDGTLRHPDAFASALIVASDLWDPWVVEYTQRREAAGRPLSWYEQPGVIRGAYATVIAATFRWDAELETVTWAAAALGDSALFHTRDAEIVHAFPLSSAQEFGVTPSLVNSRNRDARLLAEHARMVEGAARQGDQFFLCTDALAAWFLGEAEAGKEPWVELCDFTRSADSSGFISWLDRARGTGRIRNDDVALVHVDLG